MRTTTRRGRSGSRRSPLDIITCCMEFFSDAYVFASRGVLWELKNRVFQAESQLPQAH